MIGLEWKRRVYRQAPNRCNGRQVPFLGDSRLLSTPSTILSADMRPTGRFVAWASQPIRFGPPVRPAKLASVSRSMRPTAGCPNRHAMPIPWRTPACWSPFAEPFVEGRLRPHPGQTTVSCSSLDQKISPDPKSLHVANSQLAHPRHRTWPTS
jgi:hypothetical protein